MKALRCSLLVLLVLVCACGMPTGSDHAGAGSPRPSADPTTGEATELIVFAAASLTEAFQEIGTTFEAQHPGVTVTFNFAGAPQLVQQITQGASVDVFASANTRSMDLVIQSGHVVSETARIFTRNRLVVVYPKDHSVSVQGLADLTKPDLRLVIAAKEVPVGQYALDFLAKAREDAEFGPSYEEAVLKNVVSYEQSVRAVLSKVTLGEADAGIVYKSDITASADKVGLVDIPDDLNVIASYPIAPIKNARQTALAQQFIDHVFSPESQTILSTYGFISADSRTDSP